jgi:hypothetical protein
MISSMCPLPGPERLASSVSRVTATMLGLRFAPAAALPLPECWRTAVLPIPGKRPMTVALSSTRSGCASLTASLLRCDADDLDLAMIDDALRELLNMTAGQIKAELALDQPLGLPRVVDGDVVLLDPAWHHVPLFAGDLVLLVSLAEGLF